MDIAANPIISIAPERMQLQPSKYKILTHMHMVTSCFQTAGIMTWYHQSTRSFFNVVAKHLIG